MCDVNKLKLTGNSKSRFRFRLMKIENDLDKLTDNADHCEYACACRREYCCRVRVHSIEIVDTLNGEAKKGSNKNEDKYHAM